MHFLDASSLHFLWLGLLPIALWLFRKKAKRVPVSTLLFFRTLAREHQESAWLRQLKRWFSLLLTLGVIALAALGLARPYRQGGGKTPKSLVILLNRSASMGAVDAKGKSRLDLARQVLKARLQALPENVITSLVLYDAVPEVVQSRSTNRRELLRMLDQARVLPIEDRPREAMAAAVRLAALDAPAEIWLASDRGVDMPEDAAAQKIRLRFVDVALAEATNVGITGFQIRPAPLARNRFEVFVEVTASASNPKAVESTLEARLDGRPVQLRQLDLQPGQHTRLILPLEGGKGQQLEMEVRTASDCLTWDNCVLSSLPETRPLVVAWFADAPDPFTELALTSMLAEERIQVLKGGAKDWPLKEKPDVYVFENWLPTVWPTDRPAFVLNPPRSAGPIRARHLDRGVPYESVRSVLPEHPVLFRVTSGRVAVTQTCILELSDTLETLWMAGQEPVLAAGEASGQRIVVSAFQPAKSEQLALLSAFPLLIGNALYWCAEGNPALSFTRVLHTGEVAEISPGLISWKAWEGGQWKSFSEEARTSWLSLNRLGVFEDSRGRTQSALLLSSRATNLPAKTAPASAAHQEEKPEAWAVGQNWSVILLCLVVATLLMESWLFHRKAVY